MAHGHGAGLLIVNADDLGLSQTDTDGIIAAFAAGGISSATAMMWMTDSRRAATLTRDSALPVGLHLNLTEAYTALDVPADVAATQRRVAARIAAAGTLAYLYRPDWADDFRRCIADQLWEFVELYGRPPTHVDGHRHMHLLPNAMFAGPLGSVLRCRRPVNRTRAESVAVKHATRRVLFELVRRRFVTTRWCVSIRALDPALGGDGVRAGLARASGASVEVIVHPGWEDESDVVHDSAWRGALAEHRIGSFADLAT
jgi:chitin disaccharide deacetylase